MSGAVCVRPGSRPRASSLAVPRRTAAELLCAALLIAHSLACHKVRPRPPKIRGEPASAKTCRVAATVRRLRTRDPQLVADACSCGELGCSRLHECRPPSSASCICHGVRMACSSHPPDGRHTHERTREHASHGLRPSAQRFSVPDHPLCPRRGCARCRGAGRRRVGVLALPPNHVLHAR